MRVFLTGATRYVGFGIARELISRGHDVTGLTRTEAGAARLATLGADAVVGDLGDVARLAQAARAADGVVHAGFTHDGDFERAVQVDRALHAALVEALAGTGKPLVVTNGTGVFGNTGEAVADETTVVDLAFPLAGRAVSENLVTGPASHGVRGVAIRLPLLVYGRGGSVFLPMLVESARRTGVSYHIGDGENRMSAVHVDDLPALYALALEKAPAGSLYIARAGADVSLREVAEAVAAGVGGGCRAKGVTLERAAEVWNPVWAFLLSLTNRVSGERARRELGWSPRATPSLLEDVARGSYALARVA
jgi:nucleoside-diphosphate-sugar epimerase